MSRARTLADLVADGNVGVSDITGLTTYIEGELSDSTGPQGPAGPQGPTGADGAQGPQGPQGTAAPFTLTNNTLTITTG